MTAVLFGSFVANGAPVEEKVTGDKDVTRPWESKKTAEIGMLSAG